MNAPKTPTLRTIASIVLIFACGALFGCSDDTPLGPPSPTGATDIGGPSMTSAPPPSAGGNPKVVVPQSQQQAQDTVLNYLKRTLQGLPPGTTLDATRYGGASVTASCEDSPTGPGKPPMDFATTGDLKLPNGTDAEAAIAQAGELWKSWGWNVQERDGFRKPNRFGDAPDGYRLQIVAAYPPGSPPVVNAVSPCFPGELARNDIPFPTVLQP